MEETGAETIPQKVKQIYTAGPMSGYPEFNFPAFFAKEAELTEAGWKVWNPAKKEEEAHLDKEAVKTGDVAKAIAAGFDFRKVFLWDAEKVILSDAIYMLKGWEASPGACAEHAIATVMKKHYPEYEIYYE
jgi:hypothetical protein